VLPFNNVEMNCVLTLPVDGRFFVTAELYGRAWQIGTILGRLSSPATVRTASRQSLSRSMDDHHEIFCDNAEAQIGRQR
jgi:hypothetical protein